jgi:hypothetical protein
MQTLASNRGLTLSTQEILRYGVVFVGLMLIISAFNNVRSGYTYGLTGKGKFFQKDEPVHFLLLTVARILLGCLCLLVAYVVPV